MKIVITCAFLLLSMAASAANVPFEMRVLNPKRDIGYFVGDIIQRSVELEVKPPYRLAAGSLPIKSLIRKGIELREVKLTEKKSSDVIRYRLQLTYQVFARDDYAKKIELPKEILKLTNAGKPITAVIPAWPFRLSPIAAHGEVYIEEDMSPYRGPMLVEFGYLKPLLASSLGLVLISLFGLTYINGDAAWFPGMGGPFAASYRKIIGLPDDPGSEREAVASIHHAFSLTFGENLFEQGLNEFIKKHPAFLQIRPEIESFFQISNNILYGVYAKDYKLKYLAILTEFCERCRHCERGVA